MADPVRLNPLSADTLRAAPAAEPQEVTAAPAASPSASTASGVDAARPRVTQAPAAPGGLPAPSQTPRSASRGTVGLERGTLAAAAPQQTGDDYRTTNISRQDAQVAVAESQRVLRGIVGVGLGRQPHGFEPTLVFRDQAGDTHVRMQRTYNGIPVFGEQVIAHFKGGNVKELTNSPSRETLNVTTSATVTADQALTTARGEFGVKPATESQPQLVIVKGDNGEYRLAYHVVLSRFDGHEPRRMHYFVDALDNKTLFSYNEIHGIVPEHRQPKVSPGSRGINARAANSDTPAPTPTPAQTEPAPQAEPSTSPAPGGKGNSLYSGQVTLDTARRADGTYVLRDTSRRGTETRDANQSEDTDSFGSDGFPTAATVMTDGDNQWAATGDSDRVRAGVDAQYAAQQYDDYLRDLFGRSGIDGNGLAGSSVVHVGNQMVNAFYYNNVMWYGDGDGVSAGPLVDKDVGGHEPTHGLTANSSGLIYRNESGALNEAASDIIGSAGFSWFVRNRGKDAAQRDQGVPSDYLIGEDCWTPATPGDALRYMDDPTRDREGDSESYSRDHYSTRYQGSGDNGGVHLNSGIANNFFYLLASGGTNRTSGQTIEQGIGIEKALAIFYRANTVYFTPTTTFAQAREACIKAANDLYPNDANIAATVARAWSAVGVEAPAAISTQAVPGSEPASAPSTLRARPRQQTTQRRAQ